MYGIDSGNGYVYGEDETIVATEDEHGAKTDKPYIEEHAPSGASPDNI